MPTYTSQELITTLQEQTEEILQTAIREWQMLSHEEFSRQPTPGKWSANECLQHLNSYGDYYLPAIEKAIGQSAIKPSANFKTGRLGNYFTRLMEPGENGPSKKMKSPANHSPKSIKSSVEVISTFIDQQEKILQLLELARTKDLNKIRIPISIATFIRLKLGDVFMFIIAHNRRHVMQAEKATEDRKRVRQ